MRFPTIKAVRATVLQIKKHCIGIADPTLPIFLQVLPDGEWALKTGDLKYHPDRSGYWGSQTLTSKSDTTAIARILIQQAMLDRAIKEG